uniref:II/9-1 n=1 Tax=Bradysia coprophila TaxID=38358 RepID=A0A7T8HUN4_BRACO|nr:II/9-1 [Bradysia coprophila]
MKQFIVLTVVLLAIQLQGGAVLTVDEKCTCKDTLNTLSKDDLILRLITCTQRNENLEGIITAIKKDNDFLNKENDALRAQNCELTAQLAKEKKAREAAENALCECQKNSELLKQTIEQLKKELAQTKQELANCKEALANCKAENAKLLKKIEELNCTITQLQEELEQCRARERDLQCQLDECNKKLTICNNELIACRKQQEELRCEIERLNAEIKRLEAQNAACENALNTLRCETSEFLAIATQRQSKLTTIIQSAEAESTAIGASYIGFRNTHDLTCAPCGGPA